LEEERYIQHFVGNAEGKILIGRLSLRWEDIVKMGFMKGMGHGLD